jgi:zinc transport system substrate-binding protein
MIVMNRTPAVRSIVLAGLLALAAPLLAACSSADGSSASGMRLVTSFYPLQYVAQRVAGDHAEVTNLTQPGKEPHDLELTVQQTAQVADADVVVYERGFQTAVDDAVDQNRPDHVVDAAHSAHLSGDDPHFWLDPTRLSAVAAAVEKDLVDADPDNADDYARNLKSLQSDLSDLDHSFAEGLASCKVDTIVVSHDAFGYLGRRYGLDVVGINGLSPDAEPSPAHLRQLQDLIRKDGITTVFSEELASPKFADSLAGDLGIGTTVLDPIEGLSDATADQDYLSLMRSNLAALRKANSCS